MNLPTEVIVPSVRCQTGEGPYWNPDDARLYWTDIPAGLLHRYDPATGGNEVIYHGEQVGGFTHQADGRLLLFRVNDIATFDAKTGAVESIIAFGEGSARRPNTSRFNDVIADPRGRVFAGTMGKDGAGGLYRVDLDGRVTFLFDGTNTANGMGFSLDGSTFYWTDTTNGRIDRFDYDEATGALSARATLYAAPEGEGKPDGLSIDADGNLWSARYGGGRLVVIDPAGRKLDEVSIPDARNVTCPAFGGADGRDLFVTTAGAGDAKAGANGGATFRLRTAMTGRPRFRSRVKL